MQPKQDAGDDPEPTTPAADGPEHVGLMVGIDDAAAPSAPTISIAKTSLTANP